jgi:hypothetical protein
MNQSRPFADTGEGRLRSRSGDTISGARSTTCRRVGIPLWENPAGGGPEDNRFEHRSSRRIRPASENEAYLTSAQA